MNIRRMSSQLLFILLLVLLAGAFLGCRSDESQDPEDVRFDLQQRTREVAEERWQQSPAGEQQVVSPGSSSTEQPGLTTEPDESQMFQNSVIDDDGEGMAGGDEDGLPGADEYEDPIDDKFDDSKPLPNEIIQDD